MSEGRDIQKLLRSGRKVPESAINLENIMDDMTLTELDKNTRKSEKSNNSGSKMELKQSSNQSKSRSTHAVRRLKLQAELEAMKELHEIEDREAEFEKQKLERRKREIQIELEMRKTEIIDEISSEERSEVSKYDYVKEWIDNIETNRKNEHKKETNLLFSNEVPQNEDKLSFLEKIVTRQSINKDLPYFSGNPIEWPNFIKQFKETTELCRFRDRENVGRLQKALKGKARETVDALLNFPDEVTNILRILEKRFGKTEDILEKVFSQKHRLSKCSKKLPCRENGCQKIHHKLLHKEFLTNTSNVSENSQMVICCARENESDRKNVWLKVLPVVLEGPGGKVKTYALLDEGSTVTVIDESVAKLLQCIGKKESFTMKWTNETSRTEPNSEIISCKIWGDKCHGKEYVLKNARTVKHFDLPVQRIDFDKLKNEYQFLRNFKLDNLLNAKPMLLIGQDNWPLIIGREVAYETWNGPAISKCLLGWVLHGTLPLKNEVQNCAFHIHEEDRRTEDENLTELMEKYFRIEWDGIRQKQENVNEDVLISNEDIFRDIQRDEENRWEVKLLWKTENIRMPESYSNALKRLNYINKKLERSDDFARAYGNAFKTFLEKGYARKLTAEELKIESNKIWYLPHFAISNPNKPDKIRLVFDATAKSYGISLNDNLIVGPDYFNNLAEILMKFREKRIAFSSDIKEMFLQIRVQREDRMAQRFLWKEHDGKIGVYEMKSLIFGAACSPCLAQAVKNKNALEYKEIYKDAVEAVTKKHYMDDYLDSEEDEEKALKRINEVIEIHKNGGFQICNWLCNSKTVLQQIPEELRTNSTKNLLESGTLPTERVLGIWWDSENDKFKFSKNFTKLETEINGTRLPTKRKILRLSMLIFDPLGFVLNIIIHLRILTQELWRRALGWDETIPGDLHAHWTKCVIMMKSIESFEIPRFYFRNVHTDVQLHVFCDAGDKAYGTVAYFRYKNGGKVETVFVSAKARVAPIKSVSIPRLELMAAVLGVRLAGLIKRAHTKLITSTHYWCDSKIVILWLRADSRNYKQFVALRIEEILSSSRKEEWNWVDSKNNAADILTKQRKEYMDLWINGPTFLREDQIEWPKENFKGEKCTIEMKKRKMFVGLANKKDNNNVLPDLKRFSKYFRLLRTTAWMLRFIFNCKCTAGKLNQDKKTTELYPEEIEKAEELWLRHIQEEMFGMEIAELQGNREVSRKSKIFKLSPFLDEKQIVRMKGRLKHAPYLEDKQKYPVILEHTHKFTELLIMQYHKRFNHVGLDTVINELRTKFWITHIRSAVKKVFNECFFCKNRKTNPMPPEMGNLPYPRVTGFVRPFTNCGVDYFGPLKVKIGRREEKRYGVLFTCMAIRAIHLELAHSLDTDSAILAIKRMISRRGCPINMYSDNATNFRSTEREIRTCVQNFDNEKITAEMTMKGIKWHFLPPLSPNFGGAWERLIRTVKTSLKIVLKEMVPKEETLSTLLCEIEHTVNSRPLTYVPSDPDDPDSLTPNHFLMGKSYGSPILEPEKIDLRKQWQLSQTLANQFWKRWLREYLPLLNQRTKWFSSSDVIKINDVVIIVDNNGPRNSWPKGRVINTFPGKDGKVRVADVETATGIFRRPVNKLCRLKTE